MSLWRKSQEKMLKRFKEKDIDAKLKRSFNTLIVAFVFTAIIALIGLVIILATFSNMYTTYVTDKTGTVANIFSVSSVCGLVVIIVMVAAVVACISLGVFFRRTITQALSEPIDEIGLATRNLKNGELDVQITYDGKDELGKLAGEFQDSCVQMKKVIDDAGVVLGQMADGNFDVDSQNEECYVGDFEQLLSSMRKMNEQLSDTLLSIQESSTQVEIGAQQLSESAQALAEGATDQAASIQELTATVENVTNISEESAETAEQAAVGMSKAEAEARGSRENMQELTAAMGRISDTSKEIEEIIGAIEDIASQTNLLALNASIEAARAGEAGRGFAVVADQIGKLAADSAKSAVNTRELISKALAEIEHGNEITDKTAEAIDKVVANMTQFAAAAKGSAQASRTQADMLKQVEYGIEQISGVVQNNSATAEETSAVSQELLAQAETLKNQVSQFNLRA
ncbi:MAG: HAMP domain-containing protein [Lachnospiraceae bacterium]|nr:HAMP domain-containing protein [Lachnospiraceae bacterium]